MADSSIEIQISARGADEVVKNFKAINAQVSSLNKRLQSKASINTFVKAMKDASRDFSRALKSMEQALDKIKGSTQTLQRAQKTQADARSRQIRNQIADLRALGNAQRQASRLQARFDRAGFDSGGAPLRAVSALQADISGMATLSGPERTLAMVRAQQRFNRALDASQEKFRGLNGTVDTAVRKTQRLGVSFGSLRGIVLNTAVALSSITAILGFREVLEAVRTIQRFQFTIQAASKDTTAFNKNLTFLNQAAQEIGINISEVGQPFGRFILAAKQSGIEGETANQAFAKIAASMRNLGGSAADTAGVVRAFEQSLSKGKFMAEEVRLQLGDRLPVAMSALQTATGMTGEELNKAFEEGSLSTEKFFLPFVQALFDATGGSDQLASASRGLAAEQARLGTAGLKAAEAFGEGGFTTAVTELNRAFANFLQDPETLQGLRDLGQLVGGLAKVFASFGTAFAGMILEISKGIKFIQDLAGPGDTFGRGNISVTQMMALFLSKRAREMTDRRFGPGTANVDISQVNPSVLGADFAMASPTADDGLTASLRPRARPGTFGYLADRARFMTQNPMEIGATRAARRAGLAAIFGTDIEGLKAELATIERAERIVDSLNAAILNGSVTSMEQAKAFEFQTSELIKYENAVTDHIRTVEEQIEAETKYEKNQEKAILKIVRFGKEHLKMVASGQQATQAIVEETQATLQRNIEHAKGEKALRIFDAEQRIANELSNDRIALLRLGIPEMEINILLQEKENALISEFVNLELAREKTEKMRAKAAADARAKEQAAAQQKLDDVKLQIQTMDAENDAMRRGATALKKFNEALAEENVLREIEKKLTDENISAKEREFLIDEMRRVQKERNVAKQGPQTLTEGFIAAGDTLRDYFDSGSFDSPGRALENSLVRAFDTGTDALENFIKGGKISFADLRDQILIDISFALAKAFAMKAISSAIFGPGSLIGFANGGIMTGSGPMPLKSYGSGGVAYSPQMALFGEGSRPEAYVPLPDGRTIPVTMTGGGTTIVQNFDFSNADRGTEANLRQAAAIIEQKTKTAIYKEMQDGGSVSKISGRR